MDCSGGSGESLEKARSCAAKAGNFFWTFGHHQRNILSLTYLHSFEEVAVGLVAESPGLPDGLGGR